jgi:adenosylcobinamide-phosphate synthase
MIDGPLILLLALLIDAAVGDPEWLYRAIAHPAVLAGRVVSWLDQSLNNLADSPVTQRFGASSPWCSWSAGRSRSGG